MIHLAAEKSDDSSDDLLHQLFGDVIFEYPDYQAIEDGILIPFVAGDRDTGHRITANAYGQLKEHYREKGHKDYTEQQFYRFFFAELIPLIPSALGEYDRAGILKTDYDFRVTKRSADVLWYIPNEVGGITMMLPEDY